MTPHTRRYLFADLAKEQGDLPDFDTQLAADIDATSAILKDIGLVQ